jgi:regulator of nucleoside diphosphate kinase
MPQVRATGTLPVVNTLDKERLTLLLADSGHPPGPAATVRELLDRARAVPPLLIPDDIVTMNSTVRLRYPHEDEAEVVSLVYPEAATSPNTVSVLAPLGASLLACRVGDEVRWMGARGPRCAVLESIEYQPERAGDFDR